VSDPVWLADEHVLVVSSQPSNLAGAHSTQLLAHGVNGGPWRRFLVPADPACPATSETDAQPIGAGRVVVLQHCWGNATRIPDRADRIVVVDTRSHSASLLRRYFLRYTTSALAAGPGARIVLTNDGLGLEERLWRLGPRRRTHFGPSFLRAGRPAISPDGRAVAVAAVPERRNAPAGPARADLPWNLYNVHADGRGRPRLLASGATFVTRPSWSPDGRWVAVAMTTRQGAKGIWLFDTRTGRGGLVYGMHDATGTGWISQRLLAVTVGRLKLGLRGYGGTSKIQLLHVVATRG
jgi:hypothetical protein